MFCATVSSVRRPDATIVRTLSSRLPISWRTVLASETSAASSSSWPSRVSVSSFSSEIVLEVPPTVPFSAAPFPSGPRPRPTVSMSERTLARPSSSRKARASSKSTLALVCGTSSPDFELGRGVRAAGEEVQVRIADQASLADLKHRVLVDLEVVVEREGDDRELILGIPAHLVHAPDRDALVEDGLLGRKLLRRLELGGELERVRERFGRIRALEAVVEEQERDQREDREPDRHRHARSSESDDPSTSPLLVLVEDGLVGQGRQG